MRTTRTPRPDGFGRADRVGLDRRRPITVLLASTITLTLLAQVVCLSQGWNVMPAKLLELVLLLGVATLLAGRLGGRAGIRSLYRPLGRWRVGVPMFLLAVAALPIGTVAVAAATGTLKEVDGGWVHVVLLYLLLLVFGALTANLWEETVWGGFLQGRLMAGHGLLVGSLLTAVPFFVIHLPLAFELDGWPGTSWSDAFVTWGFLLVSAPFFRYLVGMMLVDTSSVLAVGLLHASFNASGALPVLSGGGWQYVPALIVLTLVVAGYRRTRGRSLVNGSADGLLTSEVPRAVEEPGSQLPARSTSTADVTATRSTS